MKSYLWIGVMAIATLNGCIYYEGGHIDDDMQWDDWDDFDDGMGDPNVDTGDDAGEEAPWTFSPNYIEPGATGIVEVTANFDQDITECTDVIVFGDCGLMAFEVQDDRLMLVVTMDADADEACDVLIDLGDQGVEFVDDAIHPGSADVCDDAADDDGGDGSGGDGSGGDGGSGGDDDGGGQAGDPWEECP